MHLDLKGNTLVLFARVEGHGEPLYHMINNNTVDERQVFFVHGGVDTKDREKVREITEEKKIMQLLLHHMEHSVQELISKISTMSFLLLHPNLEFGISSLLEGCLGKVITRPRQLSMTLLTTYPTNPGGTIPLII